MRILPSFRTPIKLRAAAPVLLLFAMLLPFGNAASASTEQARSSPAVSALTAAESASREALMKQAASWVSTLSEQEAFASWKNSKLRIQPLGPGTHGWLVTVHEPNGQAIGYLVAYAADDRTYRLGEYGLGGQPLFDEASLKQSLFANGLIDSLSNAGYTATMHYVHPFAAVWKVNIGSDTYWLDAKSDELLPLNPESWDSIAIGSKPLSVLNPKTSDGSDGSLDRTRTLVLNVPFDPYERLPWLSGEKPFDASDEASFSKRLSDNLPLRYVSEPFGDKMLYALSVIGYHQWSSGRLDAALDMHGTRFIPLASLNQLGLFYP